MFRKSYMHPEDKAMGYTNTENVQKKYMSLIR